jgi:hypothetical protein
MNTEIVNLENWKETKTYISNLFYWNYQEKIHSSFLCEEISFALVAEANDIKQFDFDYISQVADNIDSYIEKAIEATKKELEKNPDMFGIEQVQVVDYSKLTNKDFPVSMPNITFYPNKEMYLQFYEADFPNVDNGLGIGIHFENDSITLVDIPEADESNIIDEDIPR